MNHGSRNMKQWGVFVVLATLPSYLLRFNVGPIPTTALEIMIYALAALACLPLFCDRKKMVNVPRAFRWPIALFVLAAVIGVVVAPDTRAALGIFKAYFFDPLLFLWVFLRVIRTDEDRRFAMKGLAVGAMFVATTAIVQWALNVGIPPPWNLERRATGIFPYPNAVGLFLAPIAVLFLTIRANVGTGFSLPSIKGGLKTAPTLFRLIGIVSVIAMFFSKTESGLLAVAVGLGLFGLLHSTISRRLTIAVVSIAAGFLFLLPATSYQLQAKLFLQDWSGTVRRLTWIETTNMLHDRPLLGAGLSGYPTIFAPYHTHTAIEIFQYPHNVILNFWSELGLLGLISFAWLLTIFFSTSYKLQATSLMAAMTTLLVHGLFDVSYFKNDLAILFWVLIALAISDRVDKHGGVPKWS